MNIAIIRCEKNETRCPLTSCFKALENRTDGFSGYDSPKLVGLFTCRCPGDDLAALAKILKSKGAQTIHFCTCTFARKEDNKWITGNGFCENIEEMIARLSEETGVSVALGTAHLPEDYTLVKS